MSIQIRRIVRDIADRLERVFDIENGDRRWIPQPASKPYSKDDRVRAYLDKSDQDVRYHGTECVVIERLQDDLSLETDRELASTVIILKYRRLVKNYRCRSDTVILSSLKVHEAIPSLLTIKCGNKILTIHLWFTNGKTLQHQNIKRALMPNIKVQEWTKDRLDEIKREEDHTSLDSVIKSLLKERDSK